MHNDYFYKLQISNFIIVFRLIFDVHCSELQKYKLQLIVKDAINYGLLSKPPIIGKVFNFLLFNDLSYIIL